MKFDITDTERKCIVRLCNEEALRLLRENNDIGNARVYAKLGEQFSHVPTEPHIPSESGKFVNTTDYSKMSYDQVQRSLMSDNID